MQCASIIVEFTNMEGGVSDRKVVRWSSLFHCLLFSDADLAMDNDAGEISSRTRKIAFLNVGP